MKLYYILFIIILSLAIQGRAGAQNSFSIKGTVLDTAGKHGIAAATVYVLNSRDSIMRGYSYTGANGTFAINGLPLGTFILLVTYPAYADFVTLFTLDTQHPVYNFGALPLQQKARLLREVVIKGQATAIKINGDTTEFNARLYVIQPNDKVEDLLRKLPGLRVDQNGKITANGETVTKVLVDGEEFFGDDPTLVTKNIRADMVDKIQLFDKKSDQATFTGIDDGVRTKTINVKLKEDKKHGQFGKVDGGYGNQGYYQGQALYNHFAPTQKFAAYGTVANTGKISLGMSDSRSVGTASNNVQVGDVIVVPSLTDDQDAAGGNYNGNGLPQSRTGGAHYDGRWADGNTTLNANYKAGSFDVNGTQTITQQQSLPGSDQNSFSTRNFNSDAFRQKLDFAYLVKPDSVSTLKIAADGTLKNLQTHSNLFARTLGSTLLNTEDQQVDNKGLQRLFDASVLYTHKFSKPGRTFSWNISEAYNQSESNGYQKTGINFYNTAGGIDSAENQDQFKRNIITSSIASSNITWSEPLLHNLNVLFNYGLGINNSSANRATYNNLPGAGYTQLDPLYSNNYNFNQLTNQLGAIFSYKQGKTLLNFGTKVSEVNFTQTNLYNNSVYNRNFINWAPQVLYQYQFAQHRSFTFNYNGATRQPAIDEVQPVRVNTNPLNVILGNPLLRPAFANNFRLSYRAYSPVNQTSLSVNSSYQFADNAIVNSITTSTAGKTTTQYVNLEGRNPFSYNLNANISFPVHFINGSLEVEGGTDGSVSYSLINGATSRANTQNYYMYAQLRKSKAKTYDISWVMLSPSYRVNTFSLQPQYNNNAPGFYSDLYGMVFLPAKFQLSSAYQYNYTGKTPVLDAQSKFVWNATLAKTLLKNDNLKLSVTMNDILGQNQSFSRSVSANAITQSSYNTIGKYVLFSLSWDFSKFGTTKQ